jgi:molybdopterin/thiamine biosynthesis adenylyltransferase
MFNLHLHDPDIVEAHNIPNQVFRIGDIGRLKVEALQEIIEQATGTRPSIYPEAFTGDSALKGVVFLMVDTMNSRKEIWDKAIRMKFAVELMIETRMDIDNGRIYTIRPQSPAQARFWEQNWYPDGEAEESACTTRSISPTVGFIASLAAWKLIKWLNGEQIQKELILCARPAVIVTD